jgi:hypothetical protein
MDVYEQQVSQGVALVYQAFHRIADCFSGNISAEIELQTELSGENTLDGRWPDEVSVRVDLGAETRIFRFAKHRLAKCPGDPHVMAEVENEIRRWMRSVVSLKAVR